MKILAQSFLILIITFTIFSCSKDEEENETYAISPSDTYFTRETGNTMNFTINITSPNELVKYVITETINNSTTTIEETSISGKTYFDFFDYTIPDFQDFGNHEITLLFSFYDASGKVSSKPKVIYVNVTERTLDEFGGNTMYSSLSNQFDAFDLLTGTPKNSSDSTAHIMDLTVTNPTDSLSKSWASASGMKFVKHNSFNYANATDLTVQNSYDSGIKVDTLRNLITDDIVLTKINNNYVAIKLIFVTDDVAITNDKYIFSIKR